MRAWGLLLWVSAIVRCGGANVNCNSQTLVPPIITVTNAATSSPICDATVTATGPAGPFPLSASTPSATDAGPCEYDGPGAVAASYTVTVSKPGFQSTTVPGVTVMTQTCNEPAPSPQLVRVALTPSQ